MNPQTIGWLIFLALIKKFSCERRIPFALQSNVEAKEGSCIKISCNIKNRVPDADDANWFWMKNAAYNDNNKAFEGTVIYSTDTSKRPVSPDFEGRVTYIGSPTSEWKTGTSNLCSILICDLNKTDSGNYSMRYIGKIDKWFTQEEANLTVHENPCLIDFEKPPVVKENQSVILKCSTSSSCPSNPQIEGLTASATPFPEAQQKGIKVNFTPTWKDNGKKFSCQTQNNKDIYMVRNISLTVEYAPKDTHDKRSSINATKGQSVLLNCSIIGHPEPTYTWFIKNEIQAWSNMLKIESVKDSQSGEYHCEAENKHGKIKSNPVFINVLYAPDVEIVMTSPESSIHTIRQEHEMTLTCNVTRSNPPPNSYGWFKDDRHIHSGETYKVQSIEPEHRGTYICEAKNTVGTGKSQSFQIEVEYRPRNTHISDSDHIDVKVGHAPNLTCQTDANPAPNNYSWYRYSRNKQINASRWTSKTSSEERLTLTDVQRGDDLCYTCNATNKISTGDDSPPLCIRVLYPPTNINLSMDTEVREGQLITISCTVESFPLSSLTLRNTSTSSAQPSERNIIKSADDWQNNILSHEFIATSTHAGFYTCHAENSEGFKTSPQRKLVVKHTPENVVIHAEPDLLVNESKSLTLVCSAQSHPPVTSFTWMKMTDGKKALMNTTHNSSFTLKSVTPSDSGLYSCTASNEIGSRKSQQVEVKVKYAPKHINITKVAENQLNDGRRSVTLRCSSHCYPPVKYEWYSKMDGHPEVKKLSFGQSFTVNSDQPGVYYCIARNEMGAIRSDPYELFLNGVLTKILIFTFVCLFIILSVGFIYRCRRDKSIQQGTSNRLPWWTCFSFLACRKRNRRRNLMSETGFAEPSRSRDDLLPDQPRQPRPDTTAASHISNDYCIVNLPRQQGPSAQMPNRNEGGHAEDDTLNYAFLDFGNKQKQPKKEQDIYAMVSKTKPSQKNEGETMEPYENIEHMHRTAHAAKSPDPLNYDSDTSEDDSDTSDDEVELNYSKVTFTPKLGHQRDSTDSSTSDEEYETQYSDVKL